MGTTHDEGTVSTTAFIVSEEGSIALISGMVLLGLGLPLLTLCYQHVFEGSLGTGCLTGTFGVVVSGICLNRIVVTLRRYRSRTSERSA